MLLYRMDRELNSHCLFHWILLHSVSKNRILLIGFINFNLLIY